MYNKEIIDGNILQFIQTPEGKEFVAEVNKGIENTEFEKRVTAATANMMFHRHPQIERLILDFDLRNDVIIALISILDIGFACGIRYQKLTNCNQSMPFFW